MRTKQFLELGSATLGESGAVPLAPRLRPVWTGARFAGPAFSVSCEPGDNLAIHEAVAQAPAGSILAVDVGNVAERGYWGEVLSVAAQAAGIVGLLIDGCVRDTAALQRQSFNVFAQGVALRGASKQGPGTVGGVAKVGGVEVRSGDWLVADEDGVVVIASERLDEVLAAGQARSDRETTMFGKLRSGTTTVDLLGLDTSSIRSSNLSGAQGRGPGIDEAAGPGRAAGVIVTPRSPVPSGTYAQGVLSADLVHVAGIGPYDPVTRAVVGEDITTQTDQAMRNVEAVLVAAGLSLGSVVSSMVFLADLARDWPAFDQAYGAWFTPPFPARAVVGATLKGILVEIVVTARRTP